VNDIWIRALVMILLFAAIVMVVERVAGAALVRRASGRARNMRLDAIARGATRAQTMGFLRRDINTLSGQLPAFVARRAIKLEKMLMMAGTTIPTQRLLWILAIAPLALFAGLSLIMVTMGMPVGFGRMFLLLVAALALGFGLPLFVLQVRATRRRRKFQEQFPLALDVFVRGLRAGHPIAAALELLTTEMPDPIGSEFGLVVDEVTYGADLKDALSAMAERWDLDDVRMFVVSLAVQSETGGNLAEILENLSRVIRERASLFLKVRALSSEGRISGVMLTVLPVLTFLILFLINPAFYLDVADDPLFMPGFVGLIGLYAMGFWMIRRMVDLKV
jgi:tight adherence protein B